MSKVPQTNQPIDESVPFNPYQPEPIPQYGGSSDAPSTLTPEHQSYQHQHQQPVSPYQQQQQQPQPPAQQPFQASISALSFSSGLDRIHWVEITELFHPNRAWSMQTAVTFFNLVYRGVFSAVWTVILAILGTFLTPVLAILSAIVDVMMTFLRPFFRIAGKIRNDITGNVSWMPVFRRFYFEEHQNLYPRAPEQSPLFFLWHDNIKNQNNNTGSNPSSSSSSSSAPAAPPVVSTETAAPPSAPSGNVDDHNDVEYDVYEH
eukprot:gb/GECH01011893.1/.p1 GENE.gb/GECH01011893.1/~~gb/GECH01011893.1/.p1  ORF type:complete len:261 (+),score=65.10 gb/GECH01011893.1/:1-783(+)